MHRGIEILGRDVKMRVDHVADHFRTHQIRPTGELNSALGCARDLSFDSRGTVTCSSTRRSGNRMVVSRGIGLGMTLDRVMEIEWVGKSHAIRA